MIRPKTVPPVKRLVWRMTPDAPQGMYVDPRKSSAVQNDTTEGRTSGFYVSSLDLNGGLDVVEGGDTLPDTLIDELFNKPSS